MTENGGVSLREGRGGRGLNLRQFNYNTHTHAQNRKLNPGFILNNRKSQTNVDGFYILYLLLQL